MKPLILQKHASKTLVCNFIHCYEIFRTIIEGMTNMILALQKINNKIILNLYPFAFTRCYNLLHLLFLFVTALIYKDTSTTFCMDDNVHQVSATESEIEMALQEQDVENRQTFARVFLFVTALKNQITDPAERASVFEQISSLDIDLEEVHGIFCDHLMKQDTHLTLDNERIFLRIDESKFFVNYFRIAGMPYPGNLSYYGPTSDEFRPDFTFCTERENIIARGLFRGNLHNVVFSTSLEELTRDTAIRLELSSNQIMDESLIQEDESPVLLEYRE